MDIKHYVFERAKVSLEDQESQTGEWITKKKIWDVVQHYNQIDCTGYTRRELKDTVDELYRIFHPASQN